MDVKVFALRIGDLYGPEYEEYLKEKIPNIHFIHTEEKDIQLQWNKILFFNYDIDEPICVIDIDIKLENEYQKLFEYPVERGEFLCLKQWWTEGHCLINGGFYKFWPQDTKYIYDEFMSKPKYWQQYFIANGTKSGPVAGEENFVCQLAQEKLKLKFPPEKWYCRMVRNKKYQFLQEKKSSLPYIKADIYHPEIKLIHFNGPGNTVFD